MEKPSFFALLREPIILSFFAATVKTIGAEAGVWLTTQQNTECGKGWPPWSELR